MRLEQRTKKLVVVKGRLILGKKKHLAFMYLQLHLMQVASGAESKRVQKIKEMDFLLQDRMMVMLFV